MSVENVGDGSSAEQAICIMMLGWHGASSQHASASHMMATGLGGLLRVGAAIKPKKMLVLCGASYGDGAQKEAMLVGACKMER